MIWLTWRQFRAQAVVTAAFLAVLAVVLAVTGAHLASLYNASGLTACHVHGDCERLATTFLNEAKADTALAYLFDAGIVILYAVPALIGIFWGAPLLTREIEAGTFRLAWSQSVTRTRWLAIKLGLIAAVAVATAGLLSLIVTWWAAPVQRAAPFAGSDGHGVPLRISPLEFGARGVVPLGYAAFAFVLGVTAGLLIRRTVAAMAVTLAGFTGLRALTALWLRPHYLSPVTVYYKLTAPFSPAGSYLGIAQGIIGPHGQTAVPGNDAPSYDGVPIPAACLHAAATPNPQAPVPCLAAHGYHGYLTYQPASRFWAFQGIETGIFAVLAAALLAAAFWALQRRDA